MALLKCTDPDCDKQVSSLATACPHCGAPINRGDDSKSIAAPQPMATKSDFEIRSDRLRELFPDGDVLLSERNPEFRDSGAMVLSDEGLRRLSTECDEWVQYIEAVTITRRAFRYFSAFTRLQSIDLGSCTVEGVDDEAILYLSKCRLLRSLELPTMLERASARGLLTLCNLKQLELLKLPVFVGGEYVPQSALSDEIQRRLPNTIVK